MSIRPLQQNVYDAVSDETLCAMAHSGDQQAEEFLVARYTRLVRQLARPFYLAGGDSDDLIQEGMIGLIYGVREYDSTRAAGFRTFAETCIRNRLYSAVRAATRDKHSPLNQSVPLEIPFFDNRTTSSSIGAPLMSQINPEDLIICRESARDTLRGIRKQLSEFEAKILGYYLDGLTIKEMAEAVNKSSKSVDNAVQRVRRKIARHITSGDLSND
ncbi:MAG: sigma-70 family RNA polymerase sigma factor [Oscillospiraceae bacterium]|nr:sigma-70 family RNA polymerase sigma factor [Oscillospiraceae bacterium]